MEHTTTYRGSAGPARRYRARAGRSRRTLVLAVLTAVALMALGCGRVPTPSATGDPAPAGAEPQRIVSLSPNVTEVLYAVGAFHRVVAVSTFCDYPPETAKLPRVGTWQSTNLEQIQSLDPDLVVMTDAQAPFVDDKLRALGLRTLVVRAQSLDDVYSSMREIGRATGDVDAAEALATRTRDAVEAVRARARDLPHPRVLCVVDRVPGTLRDLYVATRGSFLDELVTAAGGESVSPPSDSGYGKITKEAVTAIDPDVVIDMVQGQKGSYSEDPLAVWRELPELRAVANGRIYPMRDTSVLHPSQFVADTALVFARAIHPESFHDEPAAR